MQVNREYLGGTTPAPPLTTCFPLTQRRDYDGGDHLQEHPESMVRLKVSDRHQVNSFFMLQFIYSEKATIFCEISTLLLSYVVPVKSKVEISQNFVAFSEYMNFM